MVAEGKYSEIRKRGSRDPDEKESEKENKVDR